MATGIVSVMEEKFRKILDQRLSEMEFKQPLFIQNCVETAIMNWWHQNKDNIIKEIKEKT